MAPHHQVLRESVLEFLVDWVTLVVGRAMSNNGPRIRQEIAMFIRIVGQNLVIVITMMSFGVGAFAEQVVYKWVDEDGVVHYGDAPPDQSNSAESLVIPKAPPAPAQPLTSVPVAPKTKVESEALPNEAEAPLLFEKVDISKLSIADLDLRCDDAREKMIAPLREAEIETCKQNRTNDPAWCERFNADFGEGGRTVSGSIRPRMFGDLPECVEATEELSRRQR